MMDVEDLDRVQQVPILLVLLASSYFRVFCYDYPSTQHFE